MLRDLAGLQDQRFMWLYDFMVSHQPAKFGDHRHCGSGDMMPVVVEGQDSTCPWLERPLLFISKAHSMAYSHKRNFRK